jgi:catechol 2,3-dioxygenase-like lactoylglutathione lyase family enzyme
LAHKRAANERLGWLLWVSQAATSVIIRNLLHINIRVPHSQLAGCRDFYCNVLGLTEGPRPPFDSTGFWLYADGSPIVHLVAQSLSETAREPGHSSLDHVAFGCTGLRSTLARLKDNAIRYSISKVPVLNLTQINFIDPAGVGIELSFEATEQMPGET